MRRYFFNLADDAYPLDLQGIDLPNVADARIEAVRFAYEVFEQRPDLASDRGELRVEVTDQNSVVVFTLMTLITGTAASGTNPARACTLGAVCI